jgi:hypothetical protein
VGKASHSGHRVESDRLEADEVVARRDRRRDGGSPGRGLVDHLTSSPLTGVDSAREETRLVDLEPVKAASADASAGRARALGEVGELGAVRVGPD